MLFRSHEGQTHEAHLPDSDGQIQRPSVGQNTGGIFGWWGRANIPGPVSPPHSRADGPSLESQTPSWYVSELRIL